MGSTRIIHVLKNDSFEDIFDLFKGIDAREVIFVFPKGSKFARQEQYFTAIKQEADLSNKKVSIMTSDPVIHQLASRNSIELISVPSPKKKQNSLIAKKPEAMATVAEDAEEYNDEEPPAKLTAELTFASTQTSSRTIKDIFKSEPRPPIKVREERSSAFDVEIKRSASEGKNMAGDIAQVWASRERETSQKIRSAQSFRKIKWPRLFKTAPIIFVIAAIIVLAFVFLNTLGNASIVIKPQKQPLNFAIKTSTSTTATEVNFDFKRLPGQSFGYKDQESGAFDVTGQKNVVQKASGKIIIYSKGPAPQRLVATTRFKSPDGLIFRIPQTIEVPAATGTGANLKEGSVESIVYADKAGSEYNIGPIIFTIPGFDGTPKSNDFYAKSSQQMTGGIIGFSKVVTEEDFAKAQDAVTSKLKNKIIKSLQDQAVGLKVPDSTVIKFDPPVTNAKVGEAADSLQVTIAGSATTIAFRESDALELVKNFVSKGGNLELSEKNLTISYLNPQLNNGNSTMTFNMQVTGQSSARIDEQKISKDIAGMSENEIRSYFKNIKEVESANIILSPFWIKSIPKDSSKIKLNIQKD